MDTIPLSLQIDLPAGPAPDKEDHASKKQASGGRPVSSGFVRPAGPMARLLRRLTPRVRPSSLRAPAPGCGVEACQVRALGNGKGGGEIPFGGSFGSHGGIEHLWGGQFPSDVGRDGTPGDYATLYGVKSDFGRIRAAPGAFATLGRPPRRRTGMAGAGTQPF
jgi:hypothetical protein